MELHQKKDRGKRAPEWNHTYETSKRTFWGISGRNFTEPMTTRNSGKHDTYSILLHGRGAKKRKKKKRGKKKKKKKNDGVHPVSN